MKDYITIIGECYPTIQVHCVGDPFVYSNILWLGSTPISQAELDASVCAGDVITPPVLVETVIPLTAANGDTLIYNSTTGEFETKQMTFAIAGATDATITTPTASQVLTWNGTKWVNATAPGHDDDPDDVHILAYGNINSASGTTTIPFDNSTPQNNEGTQLFSKTVTPLSSLSKIKILISAVVASSSATVPIILALFRNSTCIASIVTTASASTRPVTATILTVDEPTCSSAQSVTYSLRVGASGSATWYINKLSSSVLNNTMQNNGYIIEEINWS